MQHHRLECRYETWVMYRSRPLAPRPDLRELARRLGLPKSSIANICGALAEAGFVLRTLRKAGIPTADLDDEVQRTFIIMANRLDSVHLGAERSFLGQVARNVAAHAHRARARRQAQ